MLRCYFRRNMEREKYKSDNYSFACASMVCREKYLLTQERIEKMLDSKTADDAVKILLELDYGDGDENISASAFEALLSRELVKTYEIVLSMVPEQAYFEIFLYPNDYHNIKALLKAEFLGIDASELLIDAGTIPAASLTDMVRNRDYMGMREEMAHGVQDALDVYAATQDPQAVDLIMDKACYSDMSLLAAELNRSFINDYLALKIDVVNLITFIRAREMSKPRDFFAKIFIDSGNISDRIFLGGYDEPAEQFAEKLAVYGLKDVLLEGAHMIRETGRFTALEKLCDNFLMSYMEEAKYFMSGIEPLIAYLTAKESEIKTVRIIMAGKLAGISSELIRERVRSTYV